MTWRLLRPIWRLDKVTASQRLVLLALASFTDQNGANAYPSQSTLARMACCSRSTVKRALLVLIARGLITPHGKGRRGTIRYTLSVPMNHVVAHSGPATRPTVTYNPSNNNPGNYPSDRDSYFDSSSTGGQLPVDRIDHLDTFEAIQRIDARRRRNRGR
jgi:DNA-binding transcriptional MocR family regulator